MSYGSKAAERIANKLVLITGASSGIGAATAIELAAASGGNIRLVLAARRLQKLEDLKTKLVKDFPKIQVLPFELDVSDFNNIPAAIAKLPKEWSEIDVLINNAGLALGLDLVGDLKPENVQNMYFTNVLGMVSLTNAIVPGMKERNRGDIVNIGSTASLETYPGGSVYASTKACLSSFTKALRKENISNKLRIFEIDPGMVETEFSKVRFNGDESKAANVYKGGEPLIAEDIAEVITFNLTRRENTVVGVSVIVPTNQASSSFVYRK